MLHRDKKNGHEMIQNSTMLEKHDRLFAFMQAFPLEVHTSPSVGAANLLFVGRGDSDSPAQVLYRPRAGGPVPEGRVLALVRLEFGGSLNPLVGALPDEIAFDLSEEEELRALARLALAEQGLARCGSSFVGQRLSQIITVHAIRRAIAQGTASAGVLAGLAHPDLHPCLVAMHDAPDRQWRIEDLAAIAGMRRSRFLRAFSETVGQSPIAYLGDWRLDLARVLLIRGTPIKTVAAQVGFGSAAAFSRAFSRRFGMAPGSVTGKEAAADQR